MGIPILNILKMSRADEGTLDNDVENVKLPEELQVSQENIDKKVDEYSTSSKAGGKKLDIKVKENDLNKIQKNNEKKIETKQKEENDKGIERE